MVLKKGSDTISKLNIIKGLNSVNSAHRLIILNV